MDSTKSDNQEIKANPKVYWQSPEQLQQQLDPNFEVTVGEFADSPLKSEDGTDSSSRRDFLKLMGAGLALVGTSACTRRPVEKIVPYVKRPEDVVPGVANWYASSCSGCSAGCGVLVKTREGRPIKLEGNPHHPVSQGGLCAKGQATVLNLYDPDRLQMSLEPARKSVAQSLKWDEVDAKVLQKLREAKAGAKKIRFLTGEVNSPSTQRILRDLMASLGGGAKHVVYDPIGYDEVLTASAKSYGTRVVPHYQFDKADVIVTFGADFLGTWGSVVENAKGFAKKRKLGKSSANNNTKEMSKLIAFESVMTLTGSNADERFKLKSGDELRALLALAYELIVAQGKTKYAADASVREFLSGYSTTTVASALNIPAQAFKQAAHELAEAKGRSLVLGAGHLAHGDAGIAIEVVANFLNSALENDGSTVDGTSKVHSAQSSFVEFAKLVAEMKSGEVGVLFIHDLNPSYSLAKVLGFSEALSKVGYVVSFADRFDETARAVDLVCALSHASESWNDAAPHAGLYNIQQPTIQPLYATRSFEECLLAWSKQLGVASASVASWHDFVQNTWKDSVYKQAGGSLSFGLFWEKVLREGFVEIKKEGVHARSFNLAALKALSKTQAPSGISLVLYPKVSINDGKFANNGWLQELPDPVTKATWDNYALVSAALAKQLGVVQDDVIRVRTDLITVEVPVLIQPGMNDQTMAIALGYGRTAAGRVGNQVGSNTFVFAKAGSESLQLAAIGCNPEKTGKQNKIATTQRHHVTEGRPVVREASLKEYRSNQHAGNEEHEHIVSMWSSHEYAGYRWGMSIDMNACTGCSSCVIGCQSENNIPVVGKKFVLSSREMHWIRIDRYYSGSMENPEVTHQPMLCQHCENAPCETVCPVLATMHDHEGLNQQVYNRCVGTRYCANNCPYKVRRFNWFTFTDVEKPQNLVYNPDITVRTRGVMEKCTFCVQRIQEAKDHAKDLGLKVKDGALKTACQQSCPTDAIVFGDINDKNSRVSQVAADPRGYHVLEELNVRPSITYLTKIRNS